MNNLEGNHKLAGLCESWIKRVKKSAEKKKPFTRVAEQCEQFFNASVGFMWDDKFRKKFMGGAPVPRFKITVAKAFELVATFGPALFWNYPGRTIKRIELPEINPLVFGNPQDPNVQAMLQQFQMDREVELAQRDTRNSLMEQYLNWSQREQPGGGLKQEALFCINEALVKGRGCLWIENYSFPGSQRVLTGCFHDTVDNFFIDPDCCKPNLSDAQWIARKHVQPYWEVERRFGLPDRYLKRHATINSSDSFASSEDPSLFRGHGDTCDLVVWYEIFSKSGAGSRLENNAPGLHQAFEDVVGDYAYVCVARGVPFPLNMPSKRLEEASEEEVKQAFDWPVPYYRDSRWPVALLDLYPNINNPWPIAPMSMGLGELMFLNIMVSIMADRAYENSRTIIGVAKHAADELREQLQGSEMRAVVEFNVEANQSIRETVELFQTPPFGGDILNIIEYMSMMFDKRTGLSELLYGGNAGGTQSRTAADVTVKAEMANVRPQYMAGRVEDWQSEAANIERICAGWTVRSQDINTLLGNSAAPLWDQLITNEDPELYVREMRATIEANSIRKPNKVRDNQNLAQIGQFLIPELSKHADITSDTEPLNAFIRAQGKAMEQVTDEWMMGQRMPPQMQQPMMEEGMPPEGPPVDEEAMLQEQAAQEQAMKEQVAQEQAMQEQAMMEQVAQEQAMMEQGGGQVPPEMAGLSPEELEMLMLQGVM